MQLIDNFYDQDTFDSLQKLILGPALPWHYSDKLSAPEWFKIDDPHAIETDGMHCTILDRKRNYITDEYVFLRKYFQQMAEKIGKKEEDIFRIRIVMKWPHIGITDDHYNIPHIDSPIPHQTGMLYMNDSDGDTRLFHQIQPEIKHKFLDPNCSNEDKETHAEQYIRSGFTMQHRITPKANRFLLIDGMQYHTAGMPVTSQRRVLININIE